MYNWVLLLTDTGSWTRLYTLYTCTPHRRGGAGGRGHSRVVISLPAAVSLLHESHSSKDWGNPDNCPLMNWDWGIRDAAAMRTCYVDPDMLCVHKLWCSGHSFKSWVSKETVKLSPVNRSTLITLHVAMLLLRRNWTRWSVKCLSRQPVAVNISHILLPLLSDITQRRGRWEWCGEQGHSRCYLDPGSDWREQSRPDPTQPGASP